MHFYHVSILLEIYSTKHRLHLRLNANRLPEIFTMLERHLDEIADVFLRVPHILESLVA